MTFENKLDHIKEFFKEKDPNEKYNDNMKRILSKLKEKSLTLEVQLENEKDEGKRKNISLMLKVISKQQKKGEKLIREREKHSHSFRKQNLIVKPELSPRILLGS